MQTYEDKRERIVSPMLLPPDSSIVASSKLAAVFNNKSESYKLFWFSGILKAISKGKSVIPFDEIINSMITEAWYMVSEYHLNLGPTDTLEKLVTTALPESGLKPSAGEDEILSFITSTSLESVATYKRTLSLMVPYRFQAPFAPEVRGTTWNSSKAVISLMNENPDVIYHYDYSPALSRKIYIQDKWMVYLSANLGILQGWTAFHMIQYLQRRNPNIPGISNKLSPPSERNLGKAKAFWKAVIEFNPVPNIYGDGLLSSSDISLDHFVPWSYVAHDELWNLVPTTRSLNSSKSNSLPNWELFFPPLCNVEYMSYEAVWTDDKVHMVFDRCAQEHINSDEARLKLYRPGLSREAFSQHLEELILPSYKAAQNVGFGEWVPTLTTLREEIIV